MRIELALETSSEESLGRCATHFILFIEICFRSVPSKLSLSDTMLAI
ncbi:uncharacterized protein METZ01_LOCUS274929 [marine metagenome]|uniref:Uncharacterized protein n=1 Tax=marine metagenome TaxID=408172 RepID=A0A382KEQ3_9ZZZZ